MLMLNGLIGWLLKLQLRPRLRLRSSRIQTWEFFFSRIAVGNITIWPSTDPEKSVTMFQVKEPWIPKSVQMTYQAFSLNPIYLFLTWLNHLHFQWHLRIVFFCSVPSIGEPASFQTRRRPPKKCEVELGLRLVSVSIGDIRDASTINQ